jgi:transcriptional regulator with XRE-family HTH domain
MKKEDAVLRLEELDEGTRLRVLRVAAGLSQHNLAVHANVDRRRLSEFERNQENALAPDALDRVREVIARARMSQGRRDDADLSSRYSITPDR